MATISGETLFFSDGTAIGSYLTDFAVGTHLIAAITASSSLGSPYNGMWPIKGYTDNIPTVSGSYLYVENGVYLDPSGVTEWYLAYGTTGSSTPNYDCLYWGQVGLSLVHRMAVRLAPGNNGFQYPIGAVRTLPGSWAICSRCPPPTAYYNSGSNFTSSYYPGVLVRRVI